MEPVQTRKLQSSLRLRNAKVIKVKRQYGSDGCAQTEQGVKAAIAQTEATIEQVHDQKDEVPMFRLHHLTAAYLRRAACRQAHGT
jgi:hypothetical protein